MSAQREALDKLLDKLDVLGYEYYSQGPYMPSLELRVFGVIKPPQVSEIDTMPELLDGDTIVRGID